MPSQTWKKTVELFEASCDLPIEAAMSRLAELCPDDPKIRAEVESLLAASHSCSTSFSQLLRYDPAPRAAQDQPTEIGPYSIRRRLGIGGMATVYLAERDHGGTVQQVAVKVLSKAFPEDRFGLFKRELEALARFHHPHIAQLIDSGSVDGSLYLVLEYIDGKPITQYADDRRLTIRERLELLVPVCEALSYAHGQLVIHRDIKPSNVLITDDGRPVLLDFGIAKLLESPRHANLPTLINARTPEYASPEQICGKPIAVASDIYSFGVLAYQLLTGCFPFQWTEPVRKEIERVVLEETPQRPSDAVTRKGTDARASLLRSRLIAHYRRAAPRKLCRLLQGDINTILLTALRKEPDRRYGSAEQFCDDIRRHLSHRPVQARSDSVTYRVSRFLRRHWKWVVPSAALVLVLLGASIAISSQRDLAHSEAIRAAKKAQYAQSVSDFLEGLFLHQDPISPMVSPETTAREILDLGAARLKTNLRDQPEARTETLILVGSIYRRLGLYDSALPLLEEAVGVSRKEDLSLLLAEALTTLGMLTSDFGDYDEAENMLREALSIRASETGPDSEEVGETLAPLGIVLSHQRRFDESEAIHRRSLQIRIAVKGRSHQDSAYALVNIAATLRDRAEYLSAKPLFEEALAILERVMPADHPTLAYCINNLAIINVFYGDFATAEAGFHRALSIREKTLGEEHRAVAYILNNLGELTLARNELGDSYRHFVKSQEILEKSLGEDHPSVAQSLAAQTRLFLRLGQLDRARESAERAESIYRERLPGDPFLIYVLEGLARVHLRFGQATQAEAAIERAWSMVEKVPNTKNRQVLVWIAELHVTRGDLHNIAGRRLKAEMAWQEAKTLCESLLSSDAELVTRIALLRSLVRLGEEAEALAALEELRAVGWNNPDLIGKVEALTPVPG